MSHDANIAANELIGLLHQGDEKALAAIFRHNHAGLLYFACKIVKDRTVAEDLVADSFLKLWQKKDDFDRMAAIKSFLYTVVRNACFNYLIKNNRYTACQKEIEYLSDKSEEFFNGQVLKAELLQKIWEDVEQLPPVRKKIFKMIYREGLSSFEVARQLQISVDTVRVQKARALHTLRALRRWNV